MLKRMFHILFYIVLVLCFIASCALFVFMHGWWGILTAVGFYVVVMFVMAIIESFVNWLVLGVWEFPKEHKHGQD